MCPACIATSLALVAGTLTASGGVTALIAKTLHRKIESGRTISTTEQKGESNEPANEGRIQTQSSPGRVTSGLAGRAPAAARAGKRIQSPARRSKRGAPQAAHGQGRKGLCIRGSPRPHAPGRSLRQSFSAHCLSLHV